MWSKKYDKCIVCGTSEKKHKGNGMCTNCYSKKKRTALSKQKIDKVRKKDRKNKARYRKKNREKLIIKSREYYNKNRESILSNSRKRKKQNREYKRKWRKKNIEKSRCSTNIANKKWRKKNPGYMKKRLANPQFKLKCNISNLINMRLKKRLSSKKGKSVLDFLPYTIEELMQHLENLFQSGMTWNNHTIHGWHIDHKIPDCKFNYKNVTDEAFQECWALKNLQPLWALDNLKKSDH